MILHLNPPKKWNKRRNPKDIKQTTREWHYFSKLYACHRNRTAFVKRILIKADFIRNGFDFPCYIYTTKKKGRVCDVSHLDIFPLIASFRHISGLTFVIPDSVINYIIDLFTKIMYSDNIQIWSPGLNWRSGLVLFIDSVMSIGKYVSVVVSYYQSGKCW